MDKDAVAASRREPLPDIPPDSVSQALTRLTEHHHPFTRDRLDELAPLCRRVVAAHSARHPEVLVVDDLVGSLTAELLPHMMKEERVLFPWVAQLVGATRRGESIEPPPFRSVRNPIWAMVGEHGVALEILAELEEVTHSFNASPDACGTWRRLYTTLSALATDLREHIRLEDIELFPAALTLEARLLGG
jgi:regulator of cell morphogenesis and NO signaling